MAALRVAPAAHPVAVREHGLADTASIQDLGRKWPVYNLDVFTTASMGGVDGENLRNACIKPGAGRLVHPWLGSFDAPAG